MDTRDKLELCILDLEKTAREMEAHYKQAIEFIREHKKQTAIYKREVSHENN